MKLSEVSNTGKASISLHLDKDGKLLLKTSPNVNYNLLYQNSHIILKEYEKAGNIEGIKYELCKLYMLLSRLDKYFIHPEGIRKKIVSAKVKTKYSTLKSNVLSDFRKYLSIVMKEEPNFNFQQYFNETEFGVNLYTIDNRIVKAIKNLVL